MAAAYGELVLQAAQGGRKYNVQAYFDDSAGHQVNFDSGGGASATSENFWIAPENVILLDLIIAAATAQTQTAIIRDNQKIATLINSVHLASVAFRPPLSLGFLKGSKLSLVQVA